MKFKQCRSIWVVLTIDFLIKEWILRGEWLN
jgi:hypothetical protein